MTYLLLFLSIAGTFFLYMGMRKMYRRYPLPFLIPVVTTSIIIIGLLLFFDISYDEYMHGAKWIDYILGPSVVAMAYPLFVQWERIKKNKAPIFIGVIMGTLGGIVTGILLGILFSLQQEEIMTIIPKSVTSPIAKDLSLMLGGNPSLTVAFVIIAGIFGSMAGPLLLKVFKVVHPYGIGIGMGAAAHGIGTAKAIEMGEEEGSTSSIAMTLCAVLSSFLCPMIGYFFLV
ncbi:LrgB family protein [Bacillus sp. BGMRC 2118]|nr:LrgB family protein [Bacillus sp. BGMRC 2118]